MISQLCVYVLRHPCNLTFFGCSYIFFKSEAYKQVANNMTENKGKDNENNRLDSQNVLGLYFLMIYFF